MIRLALIEDDVLVLERLGRLVDEAPDFALGAACRSAEELLEKLDEGLSFEVALVDLGLPGLSGQELIELLQQRAPEIRCVAHTVFESSQAVFSALKAGACGYLVKGLPLPRVLESLRTLEEGGAPLTPGVARMLIGQFQKNNPSPLTEREAEVLRCLSEGYAYKEVAEQLVVSAHTVHTHVKNIYQKLDVGGRRQAVHKARSQGWL